MVLYHCFSILIKHNNPYTTKQTRRLQIQFLIHILYLLHKLTNRILKALPLEVNEGASLTSRLTNVTNIVDYT